MIIEKNIFAKKNKKRNKGVNPKCREEILLGTKILT